MKISTSVLEVYRYREYQNISNRMKYYLTSYNKMIGKIEIDIDVLKSIRGNFLYKIRYYYRNIELYSFNTKDALINNIEEVACIIERTLDKIIEEEANK